MSRLPLTDGLLASIGPGAEKVRIGECCLAEHVVVVVVDATAEDLPGQYPVNEGGPR
ncbi:MAG: hypothetical protein ABR608_11825 [Pseudonocardiaceae bacterium]